MSLQIKEVNNQKIWLSFFNENSSPSFLQSWEWGEFEKSQGYEILRLGLYSSRPETLQAIAQVIKIRSKRGNFIFIPHGPLVKLKTQSAKFKTYLKRLLNSLVILAKQENCSFIRIASILENTPENQKVFSDLGFRKAPIYMHAERVWVLPLVSISEDELLAQMRKTTRYSIKRAIRDGVKIEKRTDKKAVDDFFKIYEETANRENFIAFSKEFIREEFLTFHKTNNAFFLFGSVPKASSTPGVDNAFLAAALIVFTKSTAFYHQGASIHTKIPVTSLLQWEAIKEAKRRGCQFYNFWGILQEGRTPKSWAGLTLFKQGFGGGQVDYVPTQDFIISPKYYFTYAYETYLKWRRGV